MAILTRVASEPRPFTPEPITDEEAAAMFRAGLNLFRLWGVNDDQAATILDVPRRTFARWKAGDVGRLGRDGKARLSNLMGIHKALKIAFSEASRGYAWIKAPNAAFGERSALDVMLGGDLTDLMRVRRYLDAERGGLVIDPAPVPTAPVSWTAARRIIRSLYPPIDLFEDIADPEDWPLLIAAEQKTNPRLMETLGALDLVPPDRRVAGAGATYLMAPFTHVSPDRPSRLTRGEYGVLYVAERFETALLETMHHHARFMARTAEPPGWTSQFRELVLDIAADLHDLRGGAAAAAPALDADNYDEAQALAASLRASGSEGLVYPSQRDPGGECVGLFYPDRAANLIQGRHLDYHWDGSRVDLYRNAGSGEIYRVG